MRAATLLALSLVAGLAGVAASARADASADGRDLQLRAFPLQRDGARGVLWLEVTGADAPDIVSGPETARLIVNGREYQPVQGQVKRYEGPERTILLDDRRVERTPGASYLRFEFPDLPRRVRNAR